MNRKRVIGLTFGLLVSSYFLTSKPQLTNQELPKKIERTPATTSAKPNLFNRDKTHKLAFSEEKMKLLKELSDFHSSMPAFNEENILRRERLLEKFFANPSESVISISKIMRESKDDKQKSLLLNLTMNARLEDHEKAQIFMARIQAGAPISPKGLVDDEELSFMIGLSHLSRLEDERVRSEAMEELKRDPKLNSDAGFRVVYRDYFNEEFLPQ